MIFFLFFSFKEPYVLKKYITSRWQAGLLIGINMQTKVRIFGVMITIFQTLYLHFKQGISKFLKDVILNLKKKKYLLSF